MTRNNQEFREKYKCECCPEDKHKEDGRAKEESTYRSLCLSNRKDQRCKTGTMDDKSQKFSRITAIAAGKRLEQLHRGHGTRTRQKSNI